MARLCYRCIQKLWLLHVFWMYFWMILTATFWFLWLFNTMKGKLSPVFKSCCLFLLSVNKIVRGVWNTREINLFSMNCPVMYRPAYFLYFYQMTVNIRIFQVWLRRVDWTWWIKKRRFLIIIRCGWKGLTETK